VLFVWFVVQTFQHLPPDGFSRNAINVFAKLSFLF